MTEARHAQRAREQAEAQVQELTDTLRKLLAVAPAERIRAERLLTRLRQAEARIKELEAEIERLNRL